MFERKRDFRVRQHDSVQFLIPNRCQLGKKFYKLGAILCVIILYFYLVLPIAGPYVLAFSRVYAVVLVPHYYLEVRKERC